MISSLSPLALAAFSRLSTSRRTNEQINPIAMYARTIPCPREYQGLSFARYCSSNASQYAFITKETLKARTTFEVTAPFRFPQPIISPRTALRLYAPSVFADTHALTNGLDAMLSRQEGSTYTELAAKLKCQCYSSYFNI